MCRHQCALRATTVRGSALRVDPHLRGYASPRTLTDLARAGFRVVHVGAAAYVARGNMRGVLGAWRGERPAWAERLDEHHRWLMGRES